MSSCLNCQHPATFQDLDFATTNSADSLSEHASLFQSKKDSHVQGAIVPAHVMQHIRFVFWFPACWQNFFSKNTISTVKLPKSDNQRRRRKHTKKKHMNTFKRRKCKQHDKQDSRINYVTKSLHEENLIAWMLGHTCMPWFDQAPTGNSLLCL